MLSPLVQLCLDRCHMWATDFRDGGIEVTANNWHLGLTAFGGPPVHFQILHKKFVEKAKWVDEQLFQEIFALSQALPGPASTKMLFCINYIHGGFLAGLGAFILWCLPGALGMYALSLGVSRIGDTLPDLAYALLSGLNAATVGIIALAAVQLAQKCVTDKLSRLLVCLGGAGGMLYTSLWFFPVLMLAAGMTTIVWDFRLLHRLAKAIWRKLRGRERSSTRTPDVELDARMERDTEASNAPQLSITGNGTVSMRRTITAGEQSNSMASQPISRSATPEPTTDEESSARVPPQSNQILISSWKIGLTVLAIFVMSFITIMTIRSLLRAPNLLFRLFANLYLAGTIIFGGGPVVIPLLREYVVAESWVSPRDFLLGLAIIQSFPGPNFNFAVYLGSLAAAGAGVPSMVGALIAFIGIFTPGIVIIAGMMGLWNVLRSRRWLISLLRGVNAGAVGLVFTAVYKLWQIGVVDVGSQSGKPLGSDPWWVAVMATSFVGGAWFRLSPPFAILLGGALGMAWYGAVGS